MAIIRYLSDEFVSTTIGDSLPTDVLEGARLYSIPLRVGYVFHNNTWNAIESGICGLVSGRQANTIYNIGTQWTGSWNIWNNGDLIGFGFNSNNPAPLSKGHFYSEPSGYLAGWVTGIILENQSNTGAVQDWGDLTVMTDSGDWGSLSAATVSGDYGSILDPTTPGLSIDIKLTQDRTTVSALRFRRLVSGSSNFDSTIEFWVTDSGTLLPKFWIQSGQFLPWLSGGNYFLGSPSLPFSGIHTLKTVLTQLQFLDSVIPSSGGLLTTNSGQLYYSGFKVVVLSGNTEDGIITYNKEYPNANVESGVLISGSRIIARQLKLDNSSVPFDSTNVLHAVSGKLAWSGSNVAIISGNTENAILVYNEDYPNTFAQTGVYINQGKLAVGISTLPDYNLHVHGSSPSIGITSLSNTVELDMTNAIANKCFIAYSGSGLHLLVGSPTSSTITIREGDVDISGMVRIRNKDDRTYQNALSSISGQLYWSGSKIAILSGNTENGLIAYNEDYPNGFVQTGVVVINSTLGVGTTSPAYTIEAKAQSVSIGVTSTNDYSELQFQNTASANNALIVWSGQKLEMRAASASTPTITIVGGGPGKVGIRTNEPRGDVELFRNSIGTTQDDTYGIFLRNDTASTSVSNQYSPPLLWRGSFRNPTGLNSLSSEFRAYVSTSSGDNPLVSGSGALVFEGQRNSSGYKELIRLDYDAGLKLASNRTYNSGIVFADHRGGLMEASGMSFDTGTNVLKIKTISGNQTRYHVGGTLYSNVTSITITASSTSVDNLLSYTVPANTLFNYGDRLEMFANGSFPSATDGPKRFVLEIGNTKYIDMDGFFIGNGFPWFIKAVIYKYNNASDLYANVELTTGNQQAPITLSTVRSQVNNISSVCSGLSSVNNLILFRGQSGVTQNSLFINYYPSNE